MNTTATCCSCSGVAEYTVRVGGQVADLCGKHYTMLPSIAGGARVSVVRWEPWRSSQ